MKLWGFSGKRFKLLLLLLAFIVMFLIVIFAFSIYLKVRVTGFALSDTGDSGSLGDGGLKTDSGSAPLTIAPGSPTGPPPSGGSGSSHPINKSELINVTISNLTQCLDVSSGKIEISKTDKQAFLDECAKLAEQNRDSGSSRKSAADVLNEKSRNSLAISSADFISISKALEPIPDQCELAPTCEVIDPCGIISDTDSAFLPKPIIGRAKKSLCTFGASCNRHSYVQYDSCDSYTPLSVVVKAEKKSVEPVQSSESSESSSNSGGVAKQVESITTISNEAGQQLAEIRLNAEDRKLDVVLGQEQTGILCYDGIKDGAETGIDCGGSCNSCQKEKISFIPLISWMVFSYFVVLMIFFSRRTINR